MKVRNCVVALTAAALLLTAGCFKSDSYNRGYSQGHDAFNPLAGESVEGVCMDLFAVNSIAGATTDMDFGSGCHDGAVAKQQGK